MLRTIAALAIAVGLLSASGRSADLPPIEMNAVISQTGLAAFTGNEELQTLKVVEAMVNRQGGIHGRQLKLVVADDGSNPQVAVQLVSHLAAQKVPFVFGPSLTATCLAADPIVEKDGPLLLCGSPGLVSPAGGFGIAGGATVDDAMLVLMRYFRERGWTRIAVLASTDGSGQAYTHGIDAALGRLEMKNVQIVANERKNPADISVAGQIARIKAANPQAIFTLATGTPWGTMMRGLNDAGVNVPIGGGHGNINFVQLKQYKAFLPKELYFPGIVALVPGGVPDGPIKKAQVIYFDALKQAGLRSDLSLNVMWDPAWIVVSGLKKLGPNATAQQLRDYVVNLRGWVGVNGVYDFHEAPQRGVGVNALVVDRYDNDKEEFFPASLPAGYLK
jgi:branched-chain amino acid transport system substrate-binding protein